MKEVSFLIPVFNEEKYIKKALNSIYNQSFPLEKIEVIIADGYSTDNTIKKIKNFKDENKELDIKIIKNPKKNTSVGRNLCLKKAKGKYVMNFSGHAIAKENLIETLIKKLEILPKNIVGIGCSNLTPNKGNFVSQVLGVIFSSKMGGSNSFDQNKLLSKEKIIKSMAFTLYKKKALMQINGFDEEFWCGQDGELNLRLRKKKYKIYYTPKTHVFLHKRSTIKKFIRQMYRYGIARAKIMKKHKDSIKLIYILPLIFVFGIIGLTILSFFNFFIFSIFLLFIIFFLALSFISSFLIKKSIVIILISPLFYFLLYFSYGFGIIKGLIYHKF